MYMPKRLKVGLSAVCSFIALWQNVHPAKSGGPILCCREAQFEG